MGKQGHLARWLVRGSLLVAFAAAAVALPAATRARAADGPAVAACPWANTALSPDLRALALLSASSLEQKLRWLVEPAANNPSETVVSGPGGSATYPAQVPCTPTIQYTDGPWGVSGPTGVTAFPVPIAQTASWDPRLSWAKGQAEADEAFQNHRNVILGPGLNIARHPYNGRNSEYMGEDPFLAGTLAAQWIEGIQEGNPNEPVESVVKHFLGNDQELDRQTSNSIIDSRTIHEIYGLAFAIALQEGKPNGVMCAYPQVNGTYACENADLIRTYLKGELGFRGWVVSDFFGDHSTTGSLQGGMDQELVAPRFYSPSNLEAAIALNPGLQLLVDDAAFRVVRAHIAAGLFDHALPASVNPNASTDAHKQVALQMAEEGTVLLKNDGGVLPLARHHLKIAVIGPTASATPTDGVSAQTTCTATALAFGGGPARPVVDCSQVQAPLDAITARAAQDGDTVTYDDGSDLASAAATARAADVAIVFGYYTEGEGADRPNLDLDGNGDALVSAVGGANRNTVAILETGSAVLMPWLDQVKGVLEAWYPGVEQGPALAALLWGDVNPSGKLPVSFPVSTSDLPIQSAAQYPGTVVNGIRQYDYSEGLEVGYRWYDSQHIRPLFSFGYGLSYTTFAYDHLQVTPSVVQGSRPVQVRFRLTNTGRRAGTEVAQVYVTLPPAAGEPSKKLVGYTRVSLRPGETQNVEIDVDPGSADHPLSYWDAGSQRWTTPDGDYTFAIGGSVDEIAQTDTVRVHSPGRF